jgi:hypothetical protein
LFNLVRGLPDTLRYENHMMLAEGDYVIAHGRFSGHARPRSWIAADIVRLEEGKLVEHWDVLQDEATQAESLSVFRCSAMVSRPKRIDNVQALTGDQNAGGPAAHRRQASG